jgi:hypothetical protein
VRNSLQPPGKSERRFVLAPMSWSRKEKDFKMSEIIFFQIYHPTPWRDSISRSRTLTIKLEHAARAIADIIPEGGRETGGADLLADHRVRVGPGPRERLGRHLGGDDVNNVLSNKINCHWRRNKYKTDIFFSLARSRTRGRVFAKSWQF